MHFWNHQCSEIYKAKSLNLSLIILQGMDVVRKIEATQTDGRDKPSQDVVIAGTRVEENIEPISVTKDDAKK